MPDLKLFGKNLGDPFKSKSTQTKEDQIPSGNKNFFGSTLYSARGGPATFDANKYQIEQHAYPSDLMGNLTQYGSNYVVFYVNAAIDSKLIRDDPTATVEDNTPRDNGELLALSNKFNTGIGGAVAAPAAGALGTLALSGNLTTSSVVNGVATRGLSTAALTTGAAVGLGAAALATAASTLSGQKKRLKTAIALHSPNNMSTTYSVNYDDSEDLDIYAMGIAAAGGTAAFGQAAKQNGASNVSSEGALSSIAAAGLGLGLSKLPGTAGISKLTGLAPNPRKEQLFKNVNFRTFNFDYQFYPRDAKEAQNVLNIIYQFKLHMHPEFKDANNFLYIYPSEFDIFYYNGTEENMNVNRHTSCVLTDMTVNYSPNGQFTTFENGMPTQINITLTFKELATLTKEKIQDGL
jgi:hypothetical protein